MLRHWRALWAGLAALTLSALVVGGSLAQVVQVEIKTKVGGAVVKVGDKVPAFEAIDDQGKTWKSTDVVGKKIVVLYFYPADFTGGCTAQACGYRDNIEKLKGADIEVIGVSGDSASTHKLFKAHHKLTFTLLADEKGDVAKLFGLAVKAGGESPTIDAEGKKGKAARGATIGRSTVVIDKAGKVVAIDAVTKAGEDSKRIADLVKGIK